MKTRSRKFARVQAFTAKWLDARIAQAQRDNVRLILSEEITPGLQLGVGARVITWTVVARPTGTDLDGRRPSVQAHVVGDYSSMSISEARLKAEEVRAEVRAGRDPTAVRRAARQQALTEKRRAAAAVLDRQQMLEKILAEAAQPKGRGLPLPKPRFPAAQCDFSVLKDASLDQCARAFALHGLTGVERYRRNTYRDVQMALEEMAAGGLRPHELRKGRIGDLVREAGDRPATARHRAGALNRLFTWLIEKDAVDASPVRAIRLPPPPNARQSVPAAEVVKSLWEGAESLSAVRRDFLRFMILCPLRRQEAANLRIRNIVRDGSRLEIRLSAAQTKTKRNFALPLVGRAREIVEQILAARPEAKPNEFLFQLAPGGRAFSAWKRLNEAILAATGIHVRWHDFRRLFATALGDHAVAEFNVVDSALAHSGGAEGRGSAAAYHQSAQRRSRRALLRAWDRIVEAAVETGRWPADEDEDDGAAGNVVPFRRQV